MHHCCSVRTDRLIRRWPAHLRCRTDPVAQPLTVHSLFRLVGRGFNFDHQMWMGQLMDCHGGAGRPTLTEVLRVHFIVASKIIHIDQKGRHIHDIGQGAIHAFENIRYIVYDSSGLYLNVQPRCALIIHFGTGDRIVRAPGTDPRYKQIIPGSAARLNAGSPRNRKASPATA